MQNYELLVERIVTSSGLTKEEVERRIEAKKAKLSGLISKEGAAQIIAAELGVSFDNIQVKIHELMPGMKKVNLIGKVITIFPVREYNKNNRSGKIGSLILADETGNIRVVLWDTNHIGLIENGTIKQDDVIEIKNGAMRETEIHLSAFSEFKKSDVLLGEVKRERQTLSATIDKVQQGQSVRVRGIIVQMFNPRFFNVCPECSKKVIQDAAGFTCNEHGKVTPKERVLLNLVLDDGTETIRAVLFSEQIAKLTSLAEQDLKDTEKLIVFKEDLMGSEIYLSGNVKKNELFNNLEIMANNVERVDMDKLIAELEKN